MFSIFDLTSCSLHSEISGSGITIFFYEIIIIHLIFLAPFYFSPLQHLITVVIASFFASAFLLFFAFSSFSLKLAYFSKVSLSVILYF